MNGKLFFRVYLLISTVSVTTCIIEEEEKSLPELITVPVSDITIHSAVLGGFIIGDGGVEVTTRGICWGTTKDPEISGLKLDVGTGTGRFTFTLTRLEQNTLYYAKAYATNRIGTAYGNEVQFTTKPARAATVVTEVIFIGYYSVCVGVVIKDDGGDTVTEKGICWATKENPTVINNDTLINHMFEDEDCISPLKPGSVYHARAYAINSVDTSYGEDISITTLAVPEVTTGTVSNISCDSAMVGGDVISIGDVYDQDKIEIGICYGTNKNPTINGSHVKADTQDTGGFTCNLKNLTPATLYHVRAYVSWFDCDFYTVYGNEVTFITDNTRSGK